MNNSIELTKKFYDKRAIIQSIAAYKDIASIKMSESQDYYICTVESSNHSPQLVLNEFSNYVLGLMNL
ncbi:hypothetical protein SAMN04487928_11767 [Butyrivibrio proteoclasticus]|uniref:Uncharacterized protein n=1 Tax=Butyrivibrio proteoclasticus TaxID=43305 RepID=A0A1I5VIY3_9FIRM|nr:hypothetical protein SAMN04487928_11767 [Butyrivibrio proteoclasticus]